MAPSAILTGNVVSSQPGNVIDLKVYRERRKAARPEVAMSLPDQPLLVPYYTPAFFFGFWPGWMVMAPAAVFGCYGPATQ